TVSPGASCSSRKSPIRMISSVGTLEASRRSASEKIRKSGLDPEIGPAARDPARLIVVVLQRGAGHRDEQPLDRHPERNLGVDALGELGIELAALGRIDLEGRRIDQLVDI